MTDIEQHIAMELDDEKAQSLGIPPRNNGDYQENPVGFVEV